MTNRERARSLLMGFEQVFWPKYSGPRAAEAPRLLEDAIAKALAQCEADVLEKAAIICETTEYDYSGASLLSAAAQIRALKGDHGR